MKCPKCGGKWRAPQNYLNQAMRCPFCGTTVPALMPGMPYNIVDSDPSKVGSLPTEYIESLPENIGEYEEFNNIVKLEEHSITLKEIIDDLAFAEEFTEHDNLVMLKCIAKPFLMGSSERELGHYGDETLHEVDISRDFYIGKYPITQYQFKAIMGTNPSQFVFCDNPVEKVTWFEAMEFCEKLNSKTQGLRPTGFKFILPTEAQWEFACRATMLSSINSGKNIMSEKGICSNLDRFAWYEANSRARTHTIGKKRPNYWNFYDMQGNVWEWCLDWYAPYKESTNVKILTIDPFGPLDGDVKVCRGGCYSLPPRLCRSAMRFRAKPDSRFDTIGFRVAMVKEQ